MTINCVFFLLKIKYAIFFILKYFIERRKVLSKKIVITSGKGGVGKTTVTANLGRALASLGLSVALVDVDFGLNNLDVVVGVENKLTYDIMDVFEGRCRIKQALIQDSELKNLYILPSFNVESSTTLGGQNIKLILDSMSKLFDFILIDCPAGIDIGFHKAVSCADEAIVVTSPNVTSLRDANKAISILNSYKLNKVSLIVNRARGDLIASEKMILPTDIKDILKINLLGVLPEEDSIFLCSGYPLPKRTESYKAYKVLANNLVNNKDKLYDVTSKYSGFFGSIKRSLRKKI